MKGVSTAFQNIATVLDTVAERRADENGYEITAIRPCADDLVTTDTVSVDLELRIPLLTSEEPSLHSQIRANSVEVRDDGFLYVELGATTSMDDPEGDSTPSRPKQRTDENGSDEYDELPEVSLDHESQETSESGSDPEKTTESHDDAEDDGRTATGSGDDRDTPAYRDEEKLREVYEEYDTFSEMTAALDVDVTSQTVRRHMIKYGIHQPSSNDGQNPATLLLEADPDTVLGDGGREDAGRNRNDETTGRDGTNESGRDRTNENGASRDASNPDAHGEQEAIEESERVAGTEGLETSGSASGNGKADLNVGSGNENEQGGETNGAGGKTRNSSSKNGNGNRGEADRLLDVPDDKRVEELEECENVDVRHDLTIGEIKAVVRDAKTLYEAQNRLNLSRETTRRLLGTLNVLDLVHCRISTRDVQERALEDINRRIHSSITTEKV